MNAKGWIRVAVLASAVVFLFGAVNAQEVTTAPLQVNTAKLQAEPDAELVQQFLDATALLYAQNEGGTLTMVCTTTAFETGDKPGVYRFVSMSHCVAEDDADHDRVQLDPKNWFITFDEADEKRFIPAKVIAAGYRKRGDDFAVLEVKVDRPVTVMPFAAQPASLGEPLINIASPAGLGRQLFSGHVSLARLSRPVKSRGYDWQNAILLQASIGGGSSGSAAVSLRQRGIIALLVGNIEGGESMNIVAIPADRFLKFWEESKAGRYKWFRPEQGGLTPPEATDP